MLSPQLYCGNPRILCGAKVALFIATINASTARVTCMTKIVLGSLMRCLEETKRPVAGDYESRYCKNLPKTKRSRFPPAWEAPPVRTLYDYLVLEVDHSSMALRMEALDTS